MVIQRCRRSLVTPSHSSPFFTLLNVRPILYRIRIRRRSLNRSLATASRDEPPISAPEANASAAARRKELRSWRAYSHRRYRAVEEALRLRIGPNVDDAAARRLESDLGRTGADRGVAPDFTNPGALSGYALSHFGRARLVGDLLVQGRPDWLRQRVGELFSSRCGDDGKLAAEATTPCRAASLGGGPGYDFLSLSTLSEFRRGPDVRATVFEYEPRWKPVVAEMEASVAAVHGTGQQRHSCGFEPCDIAAPLDAEANADSIAREASSLDVFVCAYCVVENASLLRRRDFVFFRDVFAEASDGALFVFADTTHRLWPDLADAAKSSGLRASCPHLSGAGKVGWHLVLMKDGASLRVGLDDADRALYDRFKRDDEAHRARLRRGWKRQEPKVRGAK